MSEESEINNANPTFISFINWGFQALLLAIVTWGVSELSSLARSVQDLNIKMAVVLERDQVRGEEMKDFKVRLERVERGFRRLGE